MAHVGAAVFSHYRMCSLIMFSVFSHYRMCSLTMQGRRLEMAHDMCLMYVCMYVCRLEMAHDMRLKLHVDAQHSLQLLLAHQQEVLCVCGGVGGVGG